MMQQAVHVHVHSFDAAAGVLEVTIQLHDGTVVVRGKNVGLEAGASVQSILEGIARRAFDVQARQALDPTLKAPVHVGPRLRELLG